MRGGDDAESEDADVGETEDYAGEGTAADGLPVPTIRQAVLPSSGTGSDNG